MYGVLTTRATTNRLECIFSYCDAKTVPFGLLRIITKEATCLSSLNYPCFLIIIQSLSTEYLRVIRGQEAGGPRTKAQH